MAQNPTVYLDTSIISAYSYAGPDVVMLARRLHTREWWDYEREHFRVLTSVFTEMELRQGSFRGQADCLSMVRRQPYIAPSATMRRLTGEILERGIVPANKPVDSTHLAISTIHGIDYLLTWNYAHLANPTVQAQMARLCDRLGLVCPTLVSPESIPQVRFGQSIRRRLNR